MTDAPKLSHNETIKTKSRFLRGTLEEGLAEVATGAISEDDQQLIKFHGIYLQDDRDLRPERAKRKLDKAYSFMARLRVPGGVLSAQQYLGMDKLADERGNHSLRLTTRQSIQFHGVIKTNLRPALRQIDSVLLDTIAACAERIRRSGLCPGGTDGARHQRASSAAQRRLAGSFHRWRKGNRGAGGGADLWRDLSAAKIQDRGRGTAAE
jgi:sulfite reductase (NADPH) hemoprotein beta-component